VQFDLVVDWQRWYQEALELGLAFLAFCYVLYLRGSFCASASRSSGHRGAVAALAFRQGALQLFSAAQDRSIKVWSMADLRLHLDSLFRAPERRRGPRLPAPGRGCSPSAAAGTAGIWKASRCAAAGPWALLGPLLCSPHLTEKAKLVLPAPLLTLVLSPPACSLTPSPMPGP